ncbi:MAG: penicillin acylase family protein [Ornithinimicrobium sp.]
MPRLLRRAVVPAIAVLVVVAVAASVLGVGLARRSFPQVSGEVVLTSLQAPVEVIRDEQGIAHIYADTSADLFRGQGYVAAQDRFFQMDLRRHITAGRLSEMVGFEGVDTDTVIRTMGWRKVAEQELAMLDPATRQYLQAYAAGVNDYLAGKSASQISLEYVVLAQSAPDYQIEPWDELDSLTWLKAMAWDLRDNYEDELARARLAGEITPAQMESLYPSYPFATNAPILSAEEWRPGSASPQTDPAEPSQAPGEGESDTGQSSESDTGQLPESGAEELRQNNAAGNPGAAFGATLEALDLVPPLIADGAGIGSNSWVVSGEHTESGMPLLANDPHLGVTQPGIWLQAGLHCRELSEECPFDVTGYTFAGFPGVVIGHNQDVAWGLTNLKPDVTDFYLEDVSGREYRRDSEMEPVESRSETIKVAGDEDVEILIRSTVHGPILSDVLAPVAQAGVDPPLSGVASNRTYAVSMAWTGLEPATTADALFALNVAADWEDFRSAAELFAVPSQNLMYADTEGNIGYQAPGMIPIRQASTTGAVPGFWPSPGWDSAYDWRGFVPFEQLPYVLNPKDGVIVTANQAVAQARQPFLTTEWDKGYRAQRIADLLATEMADGPLDVATMTAIQADTHNAFADTLIPYLLDVSVGTDDFFAEPVELLRAWDRGAPHSDGEQGSAAMYYYAVWSNLLALTVNDELPPDLQVSGNSRSMLIMANLLEDPDNAWWDDKSTPGIVESRDTILSQAMTDARLELTREISKNPDDWQWGRLHDLTARHQVLGDEERPAIVRGIFNSGPYAMPGGSALVNANNWEAGTDSFTVISAPSMRMVVDLSDLDKSVWVNQGGNSGHAFHENYDDQMEPWIAGETYPWSFSREVVEERAEHSLTLMPGEAESGQ